MDSTSALQFDPSSEKMLGDLRGCELGSSSSVMPWVSLTFKAM